MWLNAVEATRRMDKEFDLEKHFRKVTPEHIREGRQALDTSYKASTSKTTGNVAGITTTTTTQVEAQVPRVYVPYGGKGKYKSWYKNYQVIEYPKAPGKQFGKWSKAAFPQKAGRPKGTKGTGKDFGKGKRKADRANKYGA